MTTTSKPRSLGRPRYAWREARARAAANRVMACLLLSSLSACSLAPSNEEKGSAISPDVPDAASSGEVSTFDRIYDKKPPFTSAPMGLFSTGVALVDINGDRLPDMLVSSGNDVSPQPLVVHVNDGEGSFTPFPGRYSGDIDYNLDLSVGDIDGDGWVDVAVSVAFGRDRMIEGGGVKIYRNIRGELEAQPLTGPPMATSLWAARSATSTATAISISRWRCSTRGKAWRRRRASYLIQGTPGSTSTGMEPSSPGLRGNPEKA